jgi:hypothetical protein
MQAPDSRLARSLEAATQTLEAVTELEAFAPVEQAVKVEVFTPVEQFFSSEPFTPIEQVVHSETFALSEDPATPEVIVDAITHTPFQDPNSTIVPGDLQALAAAANAFIPANAFVVPHHEPAPAFEVRQPGSDDERFAKSFHQNLFADHVIELDSELAHGWNYIPAPHPLHPPQRPPKRPLPTDKETVAKRQKLWEAHRDRTLLLRQQRLDREAAASAISV